MSDKFSHIASHLAATGANFYLRGWVMGTSGNLSAVVERDPLRLAITASGVDKGALQANQIILIDDCGHVLRDDAAKPSDECPLHIRIVKERAAGAVMHTHSVWSTILSDYHIGHGGFFIEGYEMLKGLDGVSTHEHREWIPVLENDQDMSRLAAVVGTTLEAHPQAHAFLLRRHGLYTWGATLDETERHVEILEFLMEHGFLLRRHGLYTWGNDVAQAKRHVEILEFLLETLGRTRLISGIN